MVKDPAGGAGPGAGITVRPARDGEAAAIAELLRAAGLPLAGFPRDTPVVLAAVRDGHVVGGIALELHGEAALLRSAVVRPDVRGAAVGATLVRAALERAWREGAATVALLTETAESYFARFGFRTVSRSELPAALATSEELRTACPASATAMRLERFPQPPSSGGR